MVHETVAGKPAVRVDTYGQITSNQRGTLTTAGTATILLPSREHGPVRLPDPPGAGLASGMQALVERFAS
jgi:hypothetical protein